MDTVPFTHHSLQFASPVTNRSQSLVLYVGNPVTIYSPSAFLNGIPSLSQLMVGGGLPSTRQYNRLFVSDGIDKIFEGCSIITGGFSAFDFLAAGLGSWGRLSSFGTALQP